VSGCFVLPPFQAGLSDDPKFHVESSWQTGTEWHLNAAGYAIVVERSLPVVERILAKVK